MGSEADNGFRSLWPTLLMERTLPGYEHANLELERLILEKEQRDKSMTTNYRADNVLGGDNPAVGWLKQCIHKSAVDYCERAGLDYNVDWTLQGWANINRLGDYHDPHNHPHAYLSGTYYVSMPRVRAQLRNREDVRPGSISFYDPRGSVNMNAIKGDPQMESEYTVLPGPGTILIWPAFIMHFVHPNLSDELRISISFNLMVKNARAYLPEQN